MRNRLRKATAYLMMFQISKTEEAPVSPLNGVEHALRLKVGRTTLSNSLGIAIFVFFPL